MSKLLNVSSSPHVRDQVTSQNLMLDVAIAMIPATAYGVISVWSKGCTGSACQHFILCIK